MSIKAEEVVCCWGNIFQAYFSAKLAAAAEAGHMSVIHPACDSKRSFCCLEICARAYGNVQDVLS